MPKVRVVLPGIALSLLVLLGCSETPKQERSTVETAERSLRKKFVLENQGTKIEVSIPRSEGETAEGSYRARVLGASGSVQTMVRDRHGYLRDAWFVDVANDGDTELVVWVEPESGASQLDWYELHDGEWRQRSLPTLKGKWTYEIRRGVLFAEPAVSVGSSGPAEAGGYTFSVAANAWEPGLPIFD